MTAPDGADRVAILWQLTWIDDSVLMCSVYRDVHGLHLRVESNDALVVDEPFELQPRAIAKAHALRDSLKRRGWVESPITLAIHPDDTPVA
jgi:hypothetical protein